MYPLIRMMAVFLQARRAPQIQALDTLVSHHICMPWDIDPWMELNNGRTLTLYDLGRIGLAARTPLGKTLRQRRWGMAVAGASVRYRKRIRAFDRFEMRSRLLGWDERFLYLEQSIWRQGECASQVLIRGAVTKGARGILPPAELAAVLGLAPESPALPRWAMAWIAAEAERPWPPEPAPAARS
ncbi:acyl-CoA thioesterase [Pseudogemmobacter faecipullorum]|uniref:Acyl-CoA thioesterase n=1 Tax=Pseudogemmobacter faecipullorum TaxID=2755041 RepID=A0ABS8CNW0_9RHOB|nr:acyl-CoA thioesterase [Pseudogemmobacter faecipullorum]MCB5411041.1 acyl-CoA thioesterase [Pseudogemmobacter faecipullorum]